MDTPFLTLEDPSQLVVARNEGVGTLLDKKVTAHGERVERGGRQLAQD